MEIKLTVSQAHSDYIEGLEYEVNARKRLLSYMSRTGLGCAEVYERELAEYSFMLREAINLLLELYLPEEEYQRLGTPACRCFDSKTGILKIRSHNHD
jgi:hypothetical protein